MKQKQSFFFNLIQADNTTIFEFWHRNDRLCFTDHIAVMDRIPEIIFCRKQMISIAG